MEKNVYEIIQDWHELLKNGVISKEQFITKKNELLNIEKPIVEIIDTKPEIIVESAENHNYESIKKIDNKQFFSKYLFFIILGLVSIFFFIFYYLYQNNNKIEDDKFYVSLLKEHLIEKWEKTKNEPNKNDTDEVGNIYVENGELHIDTKDEWSLSVYDLNYAKVYKDDLNKDNIPEIIINVTNEGGGAGGNVGIDENYVLRKSNLNKYEVKEILWELKNPPKNENGFKYWINEVKNGFVYINLHFYKLDDVKYPQGKEVTFECKLIDNQLEIITK